MFSKPKAPSTPSNLSGVGIDLSAFPGAQVQSLPGVPQVSQVAPPQTPMMHPGQGATGLQMPPPQMGNNQNLLQLLSQYR